MTPRPLLERFFDRLLAIVERLGCARWLNNRGLDARTRSADSIRLSVELAAVAGQSISIIALELSPHSRARAAVDCAAP